MSASEVTSRNNRRAVGSGGVTWPGTRRTVALQGNTRYQATHISRERCFLLGPLRGYITGPTELSSVRGVQSS
jgi:hypothetical protein